MFKMRDYSGKVMQTASKMLKEDVTEFAKDMAFNAKAPASSGGAPYRRGTLRRSIAWESIGSEANPVARVFTTCGYGGYVELGTKRMAANPYLMRAFTKTKRDMKNEAR